MGNRQHDFGCCYLDSLQWSLAQHGLTAEVYGTCKDPCQDLADSLMCTHALHPDNHQNYLPQGVGGILLAMFPAVHICRAMISS